MTKTKISEIDEMEWRNAREKTGKNKSIADAFNV
jgi:hypothetical protein